MRKEKIEKHEVKGKTVIKKTYRASWDRAVRVEEWDIPAPLKMEDVKDKFKEVKLDELA